MGEENWDPKIPRSDGVAEIKTGGGIRSEAGGPWWFGIATPSIDGLGQVLTHDGPRRIVCADCGAPVEDGVVFHLKPETYAVVYRGETFYLERHLGVKCGCAKKRGLI